MINSLPSEIIEIIVEHSDNRSVQILSMSHSHIHNVIDHSITTHQLNLKRLYSCWQCKRYSITTLPFSCVVSTHDDQIITLPLCSRDCRKDSIDNLPPFLCVTYYDTDLPPVFFL